jgi:hypothetical protein
LIRACLESFLSSEAHQQGKRLRQLAEASPQVFAMVACGLMRDVKDTQNYRYLLALLNSRGQLIQVLQMLSAKDPGAAGAATNLAMRLIPGFDRLLVRGQEPRVQPDGAKPVDAGEFLQGVLQTVDASLQLLSAVEAELRVRDPRVRSRMSLLAGRVARLWEQFGDLQDDTDPRVRANAVESLWGIDSAMARAAFDRAMGDPNHRVRANALVGLYLLGDPQSLTGLLEMGRNPDALVRAAAAWAMGRTGDARFEPPLQELRRSPDRNPMVIRNALLSISRLQRSEATSPHEALRIHLLSRASTLRSRTLAIHVETESGQAAPSLSPTHVQVWGDGGPVWNYRISPVPPDPRPLTLLLPLHPESAREQVQQWAETVSALLPARPEEQPWALAYYATAPASRGQVRTGAILHLSDEDSVDLDATTVEPPKFRLSMDELNTDASEAVDEYSLPKGPFRLAARQAAERTGHDLLMVLSGLSPAVVSTRQLEELRRVALEHGVRVFAVVGADLAPATAALVASVCQTTKGWCIPAASEDEAHRGARTVVSALQGHWQIEVNDAEEVANLRVRIRTGRYSGDLATVPAATDRAA